jgi:hypothetical protein
MLATFSEWQDPVRFTAFGPWRDRGPGYGHLTSHDCVMQGSHGTLDQAVTLDCIDDLGE